MPTKIVSGRSIPQNGLINQQDMKRIIQDFENFVEVKSTCARQFTKIDTVSVPVLVLDHLLTQVTAAQRATSTIDIKFGITLPNQKDCIDGVTEVSNHLTVVLLINRNGKELQDQVDDFVITPGFKEFNNGATDGICCPVIHPDGD
ncbi:MAG: hypothetical protein ABIN01_22310 [Ferruginibacter sp.]